MITPRVTRLLRAPDLPALQRAIVSAIPTGWEARETAVVVPTRSAAEELRRTIENSLLESRNDAACLLPDLVTRGELYVRLHAKLLDAPRLLTEFEREVLLRLAAGDAHAEGAEAPFRLRPGLIVAILGFYDELRRRGRTIDSFDRIVRERLETGSEIDRGATRLLKQTHFLSATFAAFERRVADSGRIDEHALRALLLSNSHPPAYRRIVVCVADQAADQRGLWPADFDLLARIPGLEQIDVIATERLLAAGFHQRLHDALPGLEEIRIADQTPPPVLLAPERPAGGEPASSFVCRDREEELVDAARWIKHRAGRANESAAQRDIDRTAVVFQRPLPYLYLASQVFGSSNIPYQAVDALPLAAEPFAAAIDLIFVVVSEEAARVPLIELLGSPHWTFAAPETPDDAINRMQWTALNRVLQESKYLGGWDRLHHLASTVETRAASATRDGRRWHLAAPALVAADALRPELEPVRTAATASQQLSGLLTFVAKHERIPPGGDPDRERHLRARAAVLGALTALRDAHARYDDRPLAVVELVATLRRWIESQTFAPHAGRSGVRLIDAPAALFADVDAVRLVGLVESDWPERTIGSIFYPAAILRDLTWPADSARLAAARAYFQDLLRVAREQVSVSSFTLEEDALVPPSPFLEDVGASGLAVERQAPRPFTRIFVHEALAVQPIAADAVTGHAADSLRVRQSRTSSAADRYRGTIGARPSDVYAVSRVERYLECPFKYFAGHVLQLDEEREDESGLTPQERGQLLHGVFEAFFVAWREKGGGVITTGNLAEAVALFADVADAELLALPEADRALERTYLLGSAASPGLAERAFAFEIEHGVPVIERLLEYPLEGSFRFEGAAGSRLVRLRGKADRIDLLADGTLRIVDYKLGRAPKPARALQLPIYGVCAEQGLSGRHGRQWSVARAGYVAFKEKNAFVELGGRGGNLEAALQEGQQRFLDAVDRIEAGVFPPSPDEPWTCTRCGFPHVCRKDYVGDE